MSSVERRCCNCGKRRKTMIWIQNSKTGQWGQYFRVTGYICLHTPFIIAFLKLRLLKTFSDPAPLVGLWFCLKPSFIGFRLAFPFFSSHAPVSDRNDGWEKTGENWTGRLCWKTTQFLFACIHT